MDDAGFSEGQWSEASEGGATYLRRRFKFANFSEAFGFMARVALLAEAADHHPEWTNVWNRVDISLTTHSEGSTVTDRDRSLAAAIDGLLPQ
jgi:4a-hydroxytetrahydrobiopterin dehydratase